MTGSPRHEMDPIERMVSRVLGVGIITAVAFLLAGVVLGLARGGGLPDHVVAVPDIPRGLRELDAAAYLTMGLLVLVVTPFVRVIGSIIAFALEGDRRYVLLTAAVLVVMCLGVLLGRA
jgi:uncharacterized membrane protein